MKFLIQRVNEAKVEVENKVVGKINKGILVFIGIKDTDTKENADFLINKLLNLRIFNDENEKMNLSVNDINGEILAISQFTLYGELKKGNRPSYINAMNPEDANKLYEYIIGKLKESNLKIESGVFQAHMNVNLVNDGPVTIMLEK